MYVYMHMSIYLYIYIYTYTYTYIFINTERDIHHGLEAASGAAARPEEDVAANRHDPTRVNRVRGLFGAGSCLLSAVRSHIAHAMSHAMPGLPVRSDILHAMPHAMPGLPAVKGRVCCQ